jgi:hypothetical protein
VLLKFREISKEKTWHRRGWKSRFLPWHHMWMTLSMMNFQITIFSKNQSSYPRKIVNKIFHQKRSSRFHWWSKMMKMYENLSTLKIKWNGKISVFQGEFINDFMKVASKAKFGQNPNVGSCNLNPFIRTLFQKLLEDKLLALSSYIFVHIRNVKSLAKILKYWKIGKMRNFLKNHHFHSKIQKTFRNQFRKPSKNI